MAYSLKDWLSLHALNAKDCVRILKWATISDFPLDTARVDPARIMEGVTAQQAWALCSAALVERFPHHATVVHSVESHATRIFNPQNPVNGRYNFAVDQGPGKYPFVCVRYQHRPSDLIVLAHEFSHAVQIWACESRFTPPVVREMCAFLGELILLEHVESRYPELHSTLLPVWVKQHKRSFGVPVNNLRLALQSPATPYDYAWNYPVARALSIQANNHLPADIIWQVFEGGYDLTRLKDDIFAL